MLSRKLTTLEEDFDKELINRFEEALKNKRMVFFDSNEFDEIILYYLDILDLEYAKKAIKEAYLQHPKNIDIKIRELEYKLVNNDLKEAEELIEELNHYHIKSLGFFICKGVYWSLKGFYKKAIYFFNEALQFDEDKDFVHNCIANEYFDNKNYELALYHYKTALDYYLEDEFAFFNAVNCYRFMYKNNECIQFILEYINKNPYSDPAWFTLGEMYFDLGNYDKAIYAFDYVTVINPKSIYGYYQKALSYEMLGNWEHAIEVYKDSIEYDDIPSQAYYKIAKCYLSLNQNHSALRYFFRSIHCDPQFDKSWSEIALFYESKSNFDEALFFLKKALNIDYDNTQYLKKIAYYEIQLGKTEEAIMHLKELIELEPNNYNNHVIFHEILIIIGEYTEAISYLEESIKKFERSELYFQLAAAFFLDNNENKGKINLKKAIRFNDNKLNNALDKFPILKLYL